MFRCPVSKKPTKKKHPESVKTTGEKTLYDKIALEVLHGHRAVFDSLSTHERSMVVDWVVEAVATGQLDNTVNQVLWEVDFVRRPVGIEQFLMDPYYFGRACAELHPLWVRDLKEVFAPNSTIFEWIFTGSIGCGKTTVAMAGLGYKLHYLSCLRDPARYYGLLSDSLLIFGIYSITKKQVADTGYFKLKGLLDTSPYFRKEFPRSSKIDSKIVFLKQNIQVVPGSRTLHALGLDLWSFCLGASHYVDTASGPVKITDMLTQCHRVWTVDDAGNEFLTVPLKAQLTGHLPIIPITLSNGQKLEPTPLHRWWVVRDNRKVWVLTRDLKIGDCLILSSRRSKLHVQKGATNAQVRDMREDAVLRDPAPVVGTRYGREAVSQAVSPCTTVRSGAECRACQGCQAGAVPCVQAANEVHNAKAPEVASLDTRDLHCEVSEGQAESRRCCRSMFPQGAGAYSGTVGRPCVCSGTTEGNREDTREVRSRPRVSEEASVASVGECRLSMVATLAGREVVSESVRNGAGNCIHPCEVRLGVRAKACTPVCWVGRGNSALSTGLPCGGLTGRVPASCEAGCVAGIEVASEYTRATGERVGDSQVGFNASAESFAVHSATGQHAGDRDCVLGMVCSEAGADVQVATVVEIGAPTAPRPVYDIVEVPTTHRFFTGTNAACGFVVSHNSMDEVNFMQERTDKERGQAVGQAYDLYNATHTRILSRFMRPGGTIPGVMFLMSSRNAQTSFLEQRLQTVTGKRNTTGMRGQISEHTYLSDYALWECKPEHRFTLPKFRVEVGDRIAASRILKPTDKPRPRGRVVTVPGEYYDLFKGDVDQALRDVAGVATFNISPLIRDRESVVDAVRQHLVHPFTRDVINLSTEDDVTLEEFFDLKLACKVVGGKWVPKLNPERSRFVHIDTSLTGDCTGLAMGHPSGIVRAKEYRPDGTVNEVFKPFVVMDFVLRILPPMSGEIPLWKIRAFIIYLRQLYVIARVTADGFQSRDTCQLLRKQGMECEVLSVDRSDEPYLTLRSALTDRRFAVYHYPPLADELLDLEHDIKTRKVDHPVKATGGGKGSKDVADATAGVTYGAITDTNTFSDLPVLDLDPTPTKNDTVSNRVIEPARVSDPVTAVRPAKRVKVGGQSFDWDRLRKDLRG